MVENKHFADVNLRVAAGRAKVLKGWADLAQRALQRVPSCSRPSPEKDSPSGGFTVHSTQYSSDLFLIHRPIDEHKVRLFKKNRIYCRVGVIRSTITMSRSVSMHRVSLNELTGMNVDQQSLRGALSQPFRSNSAVKA